MKGPAEFAATVLRLGGQFNLPNKDMILKYQQIVWMGQELSNPSSVEGWHEGKEWIDTGTLIERINFASDQLSDYENPGVREIVDTLIKDSGGLLSNEETVSNCLDQLGFLEVSDETKYILVRYAEEIDDPISKITGVLRLLTTSREFQLA